MSVDAAIEADGLRDAIDRLGGIPASRVLLDPRPGSATEADLEAIRDRDGVPCELIDGVLVEKGMGYLESLVAGAIYAMIREFARSRRLGVATVPDGLYRMAPGLLFAPDVAFVSWGRHPDRRVQQVAVAGMVPDLAVEVLSESNTRAEMDRKRRDYLASGTLSVWIVDPRKRTIAVYDHRDAETPRLFQESDAIEMAEILPGFRLSLAELFGELDEEAPDAP